ncbi:MAG: HAD-IA family hydrolase [Bacteroidales bacterium]
MKAEGIIFDLDGTLVHTIEDLAAAANAMLATNGYATHGIPDYLAWIGNGATRFIERALGEELPGDRVQELVREFKEEYGRNLHTLSRMYDGIPGVLDELQRRGRKMAVLSNKPHELTLGVCAHFLHAWSFVSILGQRDAVPRKPHPEAALEIAGIMGLPPGKILFVGDSNTDILTARAAGMPVAAVTWGYGRLDEESLPPEVIRVRTPGELLKSIS